MKKSLNSLLIIIIYLFFKQKHNFDKKNSPIIVSFLHVATYRFKRMRGEIL